MSKRKNMFFAMLIFMVSLFSAQSLMAESYQFELNGGYFYDKLDGEKLADYSLGAVIYFSEVILAKGPYEEAAFLQKSSFIGFNGDMGTDKLGKGNLDLKGFGVDLKLVIPEVPFFIKIGYMRGLRD